MPKSLIQIQQRIAKLQRQANEVRSREASVVIKRIKTAIEHYELTPHDLFGSRLCANALGCRQEHSG